MQEAADVAQAKELSKAVMSVTKHIWQKAEAIYQEDKNNGCPLRVQLLRNLIFIFLMILSRLLITRRMRNCVRVLKEVTQEATVLIVAQRVGTIMDADQIIVLDKGEIVGRGTHDELMQTNTIYREIANSQLKNADEMKGE